ncbi:MAG TPA: hypothetical protein ENI08_00985 [Candidatus Dependentiae bacterium]|nr:hypothetical protein [Candidatus Dependentiae bacterium]
MLSIIYPFIFFFGILFIAETTPTQEDKQETNIKTIYIINTTGKRIRAIFKPVTTIIETGTIEQVCYDPKQPTKENSPDEFIIQSASYLMEFGLCFNANQEVQTIILEQKKLGTKDLFEGLLDWSTATTCTLILYDEETDKVIKKEFTINNRTTYQITYENDKLIVEDID